MYYHCRPLKYVEYGKIYPPPMDKVDDFMIPAYKWAGHYSGFKPQVWLSRSNYSITGFKRKFHKDNDGILFGFDIIKGFPISYEPWEFLLGSMINAKEGATIKQINEVIQKTFVELEEDSKIEKWDLDGEILNWVNCNRDLDAYLKKHVFVEVDQVVVPSLNLKSAKKIICREERQKKALRKLGFLEDRIQVKNIKTWKW